MIMSVQVRSGLRTTQVLEPTETTKKTRFSVIKLPKTQRFACTKRDIQTVFRHGEIGWVSIGVIKSLDLGTRHSPRPKFAGPLVADLSVSYSDGEPILCLFPVRIDQYPDEAVEEFKSKILPKMKEWLDHKLAQPETSVVGNAEYFVAEWIGNQHRCHQFRWR
jgi:hypothetical protein